jgi:hypothetical protein
MDWAYALLLKPVAGMILFGIFMGAVGIGILVSKIAERILPNGHWLTRRFESNHRGDGATGLPDRVLDNPPLRLGHTREK